MSSILKALKKLEDEKIARNPDSLNISAELLSSGSSSGSSALKTAAFGVLLAACGASAMYFYMKKGAAEPASAPLSPVVSAGSEQTKKTAILPVPAVPTARIESEKIAPAAPLPAEKQPVTVMKKPAKQATQAVQPTKVTAKPTVTSAPPKITDDVTVSSAASKSSTPSTQLPALKVSGIAYQDGVDSVAMINGVAAANGSVVEGARVDKILRDRVQFSYGTEKFEVSLGKSNR